VMSKEITVGEWIAIRDAGRKIDPETAKVCCRYTLIIDPYGIDPDLPKECEQVGRDYFARAPGSDIWVGFGDLPKATKRALWKKHRDKFSHPEGLEYVFEELAR
jgi:hypothetical protein